MNLKDFLAKRDNPPELYWSLLIEDTLAQSGIWHIEEETSVVDSIGSQSSYFSDEELIGAIDATLSSAMQKLPDDSVEPKKTVFGVPSSWVKNGEIDDIHIVNVKKICEELSLAPTGFVVLSEAIANLYKSIEGAPLSAIIVGLGSNNIEISVFKLGNLVGSASVSRSVSLIEDVVEGLTRFEGASPLPSRFIVYDGKEGELDQAKDNLMSANWEDQEKIKFLHTPKVESLTPDKKILAVSLAGASELAENISKVHQKEMSEITPEIENLEPVPETESLNDLGFVVDKDISEVSNETIQEIPKNPPTKIKNPFTDIKLPNMPKINMKFPIFIPIFVLIILLLGISWFFIPTAKITLFVTPKTFEKEIEITFNNSNSEILSVSQSGNKTKSATGNKVIGDKAKGTVEIANGNAAPIKLNSGTIITSSQGLKFVTKEEASISGQIIPGTPGIFQVGVIAGDIGSQYNLVKGEIFTVGNYAKSMVAGTSIADFAGGSSREISAVDKNDRDLLEKELKDELIEKIKSDLVNKVSDSQTLIPTLAKISIDSEQFDHKVGDEAEKVKLDLEITGKAIAIDNTKLFEYTKEKLQEISTDGFVLRPDQIDYNFIFIDEKDNNYNYKALVKANFLPDVDILSIKKQIKGKSITATKEYLNSLPSFNGAQITFGNKLLGIIKIIPLIENHIDIEISTR